MSKVVSIIVPCFNYARYLKECMESLVKQSYQRWECIIVDDGSTDSTPEVCARLSRWESRVTFLRHNNRGLSAARNAGIRQARGEFVQLLDADDLLEPDKLKVQVEFLDAHPDIDIALGEAAFFEGDSTRNARLWQGDRAIRPTREGGQDEAILPALVSGNICVVSAPLLRRHVFDAVGLFDESLHAHEDWDLWLRCAVRGQRFAFVTKGGDSALVRQHGANMSGAKELMLKTAITVRERIHVHLSPQLAFENAERLSELKWRLGLELVSAGRKDEGWKLYKEGLRLARRKSAALLRLLLLLPGGAAAARLRRRLLSIPSSSRPGDQR